MQLEIDDDGQRLTAFLVGAACWNDRLTLAALAPLLRRSFAPELVLDASGCEEKDRGSLLGVRATGERMARLEGRRFSWIAA